MEKQKNCEQCQALFSYSFNEQGGFPDKRKYCDTCSAQKKAQWEAKQNAPQQVPFAPKTPITQTPIAPNMAKHDVVISRAEKPHSYEFGKAGSRHKIYYNDVNELSDQIRCLKAEGLVEEDIRETFKE